ncbi:hypothetical protein BDV29DRAFT_200650 [Aspergillus leporis]|uniref:Peptidase metallopeptidase domain-containing protein n=1 Tax=Aspergillus leporis TaxID=41062 RepID=A0A5N5WG35_9EURO|nr:hypothetical protein BDV29DRAFT_200650 [Aspergillus leporis]
MAHQYATIKPDSKKDLVMRLKSRAGEKNLETISSDYMSPTVSDMVAFNDKNNVSISLSMYHCATQSPMPANLPNPDPLSLQIGLDRVIHRWQKQTKVQFAAFAGGYPTSDQALYAASMLNKAAITWNDVKPGPEFKWVSNLEEAAFVLAYGGDAGSTLARAFFPNDKDLNVLYVYKKAFEPGNINFMTNIFLHELGHVLGLRHEFAPEKEGGTVQLGPRNPKSVMSYYFPPEIQMDDKKSTREFYSLTESHFSGWPIKDWVPNN